MKGLASILALALVGAPATAFAAGKKEECIGAFDKAQRARREGHLKDAKESLLLCSQQDCPSVVRADCADVLRQVDAAQPTIVLKAGDAKGNDLTDVSVELNGTPIATELDGRAVPVDPGKLALVFKHAPWEPVTVNVVIAETEKNRLVIATIGPPAPPPPTAKVLLLPTEPPRSVVGYAVPGALAAVSLGAFAFAAILRLGAGSDADDLKASCGPSCPAGERDRLSDELVKANIGLVAGIGALVFAGAAWFILAPKRRSASAFLDPKGLVW